MKKARPTNPPAVSRERTLYLRRKRRRTHLVHACQIGFLVFFFAQWEISARLGWIDSFILSQPSRILETLRNMSQNHLMMHVGVTLYETLTGFVLGVLLGKLSFGWLVGVLVYAAALALVLRSWAHFQEAVFPVWRWMVAFCASACMFVWVYLGTILAEGVLWQGIWYEVGRQGRVIRMRRQK